MAHVAMVGGLSAIVGGFPKAGSFAQTTETSTDVMGQISCMLIVTASI